MHRNRDWPTTAVPYPPFPASVNQSFSAINPISVVDSLQGAEQTADDELGSSDIGLWATLATQSKNKPLPRATYEDVLDAPENRVAEVVAGALYTNPRPASLHARASTSLGVKLGGPFDHDAGGPGGWWIIDEPELHLAEDILVPDVAGWRRERVPDYPDTAYFTLAPDWVCEVLSPSTRKLDLRLKRPVYAREGVRHLWLVEPLDHTLEAFELRDRKWTPIGTARDDDPVAIPPFDAVTFNLAALWP